MFTVPSETSTPLVSAAAHEPLRRVLGAPAPTAVELRADADRIRLLTEFRAAWHRGDHDAMTEVILAAIDVDWAEPHGPRLMDEIRGIATPADDRMSPADRLAHDKASYVRYGRVA
ncbi:hypothetical protein AB0451_03290 [Streptomyces sp. NPDC052000]|uniref:hypothetical protein n=1 Tax=Streptomyces sp. NPDC052000 TaxID=3155676 RepID=UPI00344CBFB0